jgi:hypothetical protein
VGTDRPSKWLPQVAWMRSSKCSRWCQLWMPRAMLHYAALADPDLGPLVWLALVTGARRGDRPRRIVMLELGGSPRK